MASEEENKLLESYIPLDSHSAEEPKTIFETI